MRKKKKQTNFVACKYCNNEVDDKQISFQDGYEKGKEDGIKEGMLLVAEMAQLMWNRR